MSENQSSSKKSVILGVSLIVAAFVLGLMLLFTVRTFKSFDDTVSVRGLCEREVPAASTIQRKPTVSLKRATSSTATTKPLSPS